MSKLDNEGHTTKSLALHTLSYTIYFNGTVRCGKQEPCSVSLFVKLAHTSSLGEESRRERGREEQ